METLLALALATPAWGLALAPPVLAAPAILPDPLAQLDEVPEVEVEPVEVRLGLLGPTPSERHAATMMDWTRALNASATAALAITGTLGFIQFADEYGFHDRYSETACATGDAVLNDCGDETPWVHAIAAGTAASLLISAFGVSTAVDFDVAAQRDHDWRIYEVTRFVALGMAVVQGLAGFLLANAVDFGWADPQDDFDTMQGFAIAHALWGVATLGVNLANTILIF